MEKYFIMLRHPNGHPMPVVNEDENTELWDSKEEAEKWADDSSFAMAHGCEIYPYSV